MMKRLQLLIFFVFSNYFIWAQAANLLTNSGAENGTITPFYTFGGGAAPQVTNSLSHSGTYCFLSSGRTQYYHGISYNIKSFVTNGQLVSGQRYTFSVWVRHSEANSKNLHLNLKKVDGTGTKYITLENESVPPNTWVKIVKHYTLSVTGTLTGLELYVISDNGTTFNFYSDDFFIGELETYVPPTSSISTDFVRAGGTNLVVGAGNTPLVIRGINIFMPVDASDDAEDVWDIKSIAQEDFNDIASLGFNAIRLAMNYKIFEDDSAPGVFKDDGWHWLDRAIELAKNANLNVMLDMHAPQGGYQSDKSQGFSTFWGTSDSDANTANQNRLIALWTAIADRYKHETAVIGYDFINEPRPHNSEEWFSYAEQLIAAVRTVDNYHLIWLEVPFIPNYTIRIVNDVNVLYDAHFYTPWEYSTQYSASYGNGAWGKYDSNNPIYIKWVGSSLTVVAAGTSGAEAFDKPYLKSNLMSDLLDFTSLNNVPAAVGEYGLCHEMFSYDVGALSYLTDLTAIFDGDNNGNQVVNRFYFSYHGSPFSIYTNWNGFQRNTTDYNSSLANFFMNYVIPMPVELTYWEGNCTETAIILNWKTASEINNDYFSIWRSLDAQHWTLQGKIQSNGTTATAQDYTFIDDSPILQTAYYRLQQTDIDGKSTLSSIITVLPCKNTAPVVFFPNPSSDGRFHFQGTATNLQKVIVTNLMGQVVYQHHTSTTFLDLSALPKGFYLATFYVNTQKFSQCLIID